MLDRFAKLPSSLAEHARTVMIGERGQVPALLIHPDWIGPAPTMIWMHGRTASKELDAGRYVRWLKRGIAACAIDLPGHGQRRDARADSNRHTLELLAEALPEVDQVVASLGEPVFQNVFDLSQLGLGGMSMGGMVALRRLCDPHGFAAAAVEGTTGDLAALYSPGAATMELPGEPGWEGVGQEGIGQEGMGQEGMGEGGIGEGGIGEGGIGEGGIGEGGRGGGPARHALEAVRPLDPSSHVDTFRPIPLLALHSEADRVVPWAIQRGFLERLERHYRLAGGPGASGMIQVHTWPSTGAPGEHSGFGRFGNEAKNLQTEFLVRGLGGRD